VLSAYLKFMTDIGVLLGGADSNRTAITARMREVIEFEQAIAKVSCLLYCLVGSIAEDVQCVIQVCIRTYVALKSALMAAGDVKGVASIERITNMFFFTWHSVM